MNNKNKLKDLGTVAGFTLLSRVLGLLRDVFIYASLGTSIFSSAFVLALSLPNLFRRLLGEGAMTSALMPILSDAVHGDPKKATPTPRIMNQVTTRLGLALVGLVGLICLALWGFINGFDFAQRWELGAHYSIWLMPYMAMICLAAIFTAALNMKGRFVLSSLSPSWLNLSIILTVLAANAAFDLSIQQRVATLCIAVLIGGTIQMSSVWIGLKKAGWSVRWDLGPSEELSRVWSLLLPGILSGSILQINILLTRLLGNAIDDSAASILYLASRLIELPLGIFAIAIATVLFPDLTKAQSRGDFSGFAQTFIQGMRWIAVITFPSVIGLVIYRYEIIQSLFEYGVFDAQSVQATAPVVGLNALSIPAYAWISFATRALHAQKKMKATLYVSAVTLVLNIIFCTVGMKLGGMLGLSAGNVAAAWVQVCCLLALIRLPQLKQHILKTKPLSEGFKIILSSALMAACCVLIAAAVSAIGLDGKLASFAVIGVGIPVAIGIYFSCLLIFRQSDTVHIWQATRAKLAKLTQKS